MNQKSIDTIPLEIYHGVPQGWSKTEILELHKTLGGEYCLKGEDAIEPGAPAFLPDRYNWLQYRETLYRVCEGVRKSDEACIELAVRYIELDFIGSYSGYLREKMSRALKSVTLSSKHGNRLKVRFRMLIQEQECLAEFSEYKKLLNKLESGPETG